MKQGKTSEPRLSGLNDEQDLNNNKEKILKSSNQANPETDNMKQGWEINKLGDLFHITSSKRVFKEDWKTEGVPFYRAREIVKLAENGFVNNKLFISEEMFKEYSEKYGLPKEGDIMVTGVGTLGICYVVKNEDRFYFKDGNIIWLKSNGKAISRYVEYAFKSDFLRKQIDDSIGATVGTFTIIKAKNTKIPLPPIPEQQRIVSILDEAFAAIAKAKANAEQNLKNAKELFESYLQGVFENGKEIWEAKTLDEVCEFRNGAAHEQHIDEGGKYILVNSKFISTDDEKFKRTNSALAPLYVNDIAFVLSDVPNGKALAKCFLVVENNTYTLNQRIGAIKSKVFIPEFLVYQFNRNKYLLSFNNGENQTNLRKGDILKCPLWIPSKEVQQTIVRQLDALRAETQKLEAVYQQKIADLEELKKSILQKAFAGELKMSEPLINAD
ncbi:restriction endonuclease subunit S [Petrimonas sp.]|uniref:restriction endonuclease subunit S n=1 Tax=Petrimonas sp. TaxID=2023866 RepID=UPI003F513C08